MLRVCFKQAFKMLLIAFIVTGLLGGVGYGQRFMPESNQLPAHYPDTYSGNGVVDRLDTDLVVIDDSSYIIFPYTSFHTPTMKNAPRTWFKKGQHVGFVEGNPGEILELYLFKFR